jgi:hypothetical protein
MFQLMYEWFGLNFFTRPEMAAVLSGLGELCSEEEPAAALYRGFGFAMLFSSVFIYALQYHIIDSPRFNGPRWWWFFAIIAFALNFAIAFLALSSHLSGSHELDCVNEMAEILKQPDILLFAADNGLWSFIVFAALSCPPLFRKLSRNCFNTTAFTY